MVWVFKGRFAISSAKPRQKLLFLEPRCEHRRNTIIHRRHCRSNLDPRKKPPYEHAQASAHASRFVQISTSRVGA